MLRNPVSLSIIAVVSLFASSFLAQQADDQVVNPVPNVQAINQGFIAEFANDSGTLTNSPFFDLNGSVGLGTMTPSAPLDVNGSTNAANTSIVRVNQNGSTTEPPSLTNPPPTAVTGNSTSPTGFAVSILGIASSPDAVGVLGANTSASGGGAGVVGISQNNGREDAAVYAQALATTGSPVAVKAVVGTSSGLVFQGVFGINEVFSVDGSGNANVRGNLSKGGGSFKIDHPLDAANKYLSHSFVESPDMKNIYDGVATLDDKGEAVVQLPDWFGALNRDFRYQLTAIGAPGPNLYIADEIAENRFKIAGGRARMRVSWQVTGTRQDAWANAHRIQVEENKPAGERGFYLHPELFAAPKEKAIERAYDERFAKSSATAAKP